jgi:hypothetical protein
MPLNLKNAPASLGPNTDARNVVGSCTIVELVSPGQESKYVVLYENKEPPGRPESKKNGFPFGGIEKVFDKDTWNNASRELLEEAFCAAIPELQHKITELTEKLGISESFGTTADSPEIIQGQIAKLERKLEEAKERAVELFNTLARHPEIDTCKRVIGRFNGLADYHGSDFNFDEEEMKIAALLETLVAEEDYVCEFKIRNERGFGTLSFIVFTIKMPMDVILTPGDEQYEAIKLTAMEIEDLNGLREMFYHQYFAWSNFRAWKSKDHSC